MRLDMGPSVMDPQVYGRQRVAPGGSLRISGPGYADVQEGGQRAVARDIQGQTEVFPREVAPRFQSVMGSADTYGQRDLQPGEFEVMVQPGQSRPSTAVGGVDLDGDGIPDGAEIALKRDLGDGGMLTAKWTKGQRPESSIMIPPGTNTPAGSLAAPMTEDAKRQALGLPTASMVAPRVAAATNRLDRNTDVQGIRLPSIMRAEANRAADRAAETERNRDRSVTGPVGVATVQGQTARDVEATRAGAQRDVQQVGLTNAREGRAEQGRQFDASLQEKARQFDTQKGQKPQVWGEGDARFVTYNGQMMRLGDQTPEGFIRLLGPDGTQSAVLTKEGAVAQWDAANRKWTIDQMPQETSTRGATGFWGGTVPRTGTTRQPTTDAFFQNLK